MPLKLGIIGCGAHATGAHGPAAARIPHLVQITACCDIRRTAAEQWADRYGAERIYTDYEAMLSQETLDGVILVTWPNQHREQVARALQLGVRNILCEKSLALTGQEAGEMHQLTRAAGTFLMEGFMYRHHPALLKMQSLLASGDCGMVDAVRACFSAADPELEHPENTERNWRQRLECGGGIPYDFACYAVNACGCFSGGIPVRAFCVGDISERYGTINRMYGIIAYDNGRVGIVESSKKTVITQELELSCSRSTLYLPVAWTIPADTTLIVKREDTWPRATEETLLIGGADAYQRQLENFAAVIRGEARPVVPLAQSVMNIYALEALVNSLRQQRMVDINIPAEIIAAAREERA